MTFHVLRARRYAGLIRFDASSSGSVCLVLEPHPHLVRPITGAPDWFAPFLPSVHQDVMGAKWRVRSCIAPCTVSNQVDPRCGLGFKVFRTQAPILGWLNGNPDWPRALLYSIHANYILEDGRFFKSRLGDKARATWTDEHTGVVVGWKLEKRL